MTKSFDEVTVGDIVAEDFRAASIFDKFGIDFCCGGRQFVGDACRALAIDPAEIERALGALPAVDGDADDVSEWRLDRLIDHIVSTHHAYIRSSSPTIDSYLQKLVAVHGARHPELSSIAEAFDELQAELFLHMAKEEAVLFPYIRALATDCNPSGSFGSVENPIRMMEHEHRVAGDEMRTIRELTSGHTVPADGCTTYRVCFEELAAFERDLHRHIHLENNILFPKALELDAR